MALDDGIWFLKKKTCTKNIQIIKSDDNKENDEKFKHLWLYKNKSIRIYKNNTNIIILNNSKQFSNRKSQYNK